MGNYVLMFVGFCLFFMYEYWFIQACKKNAETKKEKIYKVVNIFIYICGFIFGLFIFIIAISEINYSANIQKIGKAIIFENKFEPKFIHEIDKDGIILKRDTVIVESLK